MINYRLTAWEVNDIWVVNIYANSDFLIDIGEFSSKKEAERVGQDRKSVV